QWTDIAWPDGEKEIEQRTMLQEPGGKARIGSKQDRMLSTDDARIEVGNGHWRRTDGRFAVDFGVMPLVDLRIVAAQPDAADRKSTVAFSIRNAGFLQEWQRTAAGAQIDELGRGRSHVTALGVLHIKAPASTRLATDVGDAMRVVH